MARALVGRAGLLLRPAAVACLLLAAGCALPPRRGQAFPIGLYDVDRPGELPRLSRDGFTAVETALTDRKTIRALGAEAKKYGLSLLVFPGQLAKAGASVQGLPILAWYLADEPDVSRLALATLLRARSSLHRWDRRPLALVVGDGRTAARYAPAADIMMVDWYPVPHLPLESVGWNVRWTIEGSGGRPVWAVVQAMNWKDYRQHDPSKPRIGRFPTYTEMRFMAYDAIAEGASGIWFYSYRRPDGSLRSENPEHWGRVTAVVAELAFVRKLVARARPLPSPVPEAPAFAGLVGRAWERHGEDYALIVNASGAPAALPAKLCGLDWRLLRDGGSAWRAAGCRIAAHQALLFGSATLTK